jgi:hypothetical protein
MLRRRAGHCQRISPCKHVSINRHQSYPMLRCEARPQRELTAALNDKASRCTLYTCFRLAQAQGLRFPHQLLCSCPLPHSFPRQHRHPKQRWCDSAARHLYFPTIAQVVDGETTAVCFEAVNGYCAMPRNSGWEM